MYTNTGHTTDLLESSEIGVGALADACPLSEHELRVQDEILKGIKKQLTPKLLALCVRKPAALRYLVDRAGEDVERVMNAFRDA